MKKRKRKIPWIENKSRPILVWNETLFTTIVSTVRRWLGLENSKTKVDEVRDEGEERLIETSANRSYVLCEPRYYVSSTLYNTCTMHVRSCFCNKFLTRWIRSQQIPRQTWNIFLSVTFYKSHATSREN